MSNLINRANRKILIFDIDGTLLDFKGNMPESADLALKLAREAGHILLIGSGRAAYQYQKWIREKFDGIVGSTGSYVEYQGKVIYEHFLDRKDIKRVWDIFLRNQGVLVGQSDERAVLTEKSYQYMITRLRKYGRTEERTNELFGNALITETGEDPLIKKFFYHECPQPIVELEAELGDAFDIEASSFVEDIAGSGEITAKGINKSYGLMKLLEYLGKTPEDVIAFGDGPNDIDMLQYAGYSVAMGNAIDEVKAVADYVTSSVDQDGIYNAMIALGLIEG